MQFALNVPTVRDRVVQMATLLILEPIFEADFLDCSYGFRPGRSAHQALEEIRGHLQAGYQAVYDADLKGYFDSIPHSHLRDFLDRRVTDGVIRRMIDKWLKAGVLEDGLLRHATELPAGRCDLTLPLEHFPAPRAG